MKFKANDYKANEAVRIIREWTLLTQKGFGESTGYSAKTIACWEQGVRNITFAKFLDIAKKHNVEIIIYKK